MRVYRAQRDFLALLNLGGGRALASKWGVVAEGRWPWRLKDVIDQRFMRRFRVLATGARLAADFPTPESMGMEVMACGGCAAKLGPSALERALGRLPEAPPEASVRQGVGMTLRSWTRVAATCRFPAWTVSGPSRTTPGWWAGWRR